MDVLRGRLEGREDRGLYGDAPDDEGAGCGGDSSRFRQFHHFLLVLFHGNTPWCDHLHLDVREGHEIRIYEVEHHVGANKEEEPDDGVCHDLART